jgi:hypothetical protein
MESTIRDESFSKYLNEYRKQLEKGAVKKAYKGLMDYFKDLRLYLKNKYPDYFLSDVNVGEMDFTYFYFFPKTLKTRGLKIVLLFIHEEFTFEVWLSGYNKKVQEKYWKIFKEKDWNEYHIAINPRDFDYILRFVLNDNPDFSDLEKLKAQIEKGTLEFIKEVENFLSK